MTPRVLRLALSLCLCALVTGCWDAAEIDQLAIVTASGLDLVKDESGHTKVKGLVQIAIPSTLGTTSGGSPSTETGTQDTYVIAEATGKDLGDELDKIRRQVSRKMIMSHRRVVIVGEDYAKEGLDGLIDEVTRNPASRLRTILLVAYHDTAEKMLQLPYPLERLPQEAVIGLGQQSSTDQYTVKDFITQEEMGDPFTFGMEPTKFLAWPQKYGFSLQHIAVFRGNKLVGWLSGDDVDGFLWSRDAMRGKLSSVYVGKLGFVDCRLLRSNATRKVRWVNGKPQIFIRMRTMHEVFRNGSKIDLRDPLQIQVVEGVLQKQIQSQMKSAIDKLQHQYHADPIGLSDTVYNSRPRWWHSVESHWRDVYSEIPVHIQVETHIRRSGLISSKV